MSVDNRLGGRLPLYDREGLEPAQKELFDWLMTVAVPWAEGLDFQAGTKEGRLIGPFNPALLTPAISSVPAATRAMRGSGSTARTSAPGLH